MRHPCKDQDNQEGLKPDDRASSPLPDKCCALLWDESYLWGIMARQALAEAQLPFDILQSEDIRSGRLSQYSMLFVPGGWASNKSDALGPDGQAQIRHFVETGGNYLGICGGAGLATAGGLGLLPVRRMAGSRRVPSFSGPIRLTTRSHPLWRGIADPVFHAWWPSQFELPETGETEILATYGEAQADAFSADMRVADGNRAGWPALEEQYGMRLDPARLRNEPAVLAGRFGRGRVILSLVHFDTPGDLNGRTVLKNLWDELAEGCETSPQTDLSPVAGASFQAGAATNFPSFAQIRRIVDDLIDTGQRNHLWRWRNPLLLQWRRGVRGLEYSTLAVMIGEIGKLIDEDGRVRRSGKDAGDFPDALSLQRELENIETLLVPFAEQAKDLIVREQKMMDAAPLSPLHCGDEAVARLRQELFGPAMSHGGRFKELAATLDRLVLRLIRQGRVH